MPKFVPVDISPLSSSTNGASPWSGQTGAAVPALPSGRQTFWGIPFRIPSNPSPRRGEGARRADEGPALLIAGARRSRAPLEIPVKGKATFILFAHFCDSRTARKKDPNVPYPAEYPTPNIVAPGEQLASYVIEYEDGSEAGVVIRRRFEIDQLQTRALGAFAARHHRGITAPDFRGPYPRNQWGRMQTGVFFGQIAGFERQPSSSALPPPQWTLYALPNPHPNLKFSSIRVEPTGAAAIGIGAVTLFNGAEHPLRHRQLESIQIDVQRGKGIAKPGDVSVDLGVIARQRAIPSFDPKAWLRDPVAGWGSDPDDVDATSLIVDVSASADATLKVGSRSLDMAGVFEKGQASSSDGAVSARLLTPSRNWTHVSVIDSKTGKPTPTRVHFRSADGRYWPPYGHRHEVNDNWFEDYGADLKLGGTEYAYVEGKFQMELPVGDVYVDVAKGFEYQPIRQKVTIKPGQKELKLELDRIANLRKDGWVTADSHTHFLSPETARLEAQAEDINLINLLASQWGDLYTNVGDFTGALSGSSTDDTIVWVGTENRQHFLGHISLLGYKGDPAYPMCTSGPTEGFIGDPVQKAMSEWADECRARGGVVVIPHFPYPYSEVIAEVVKGKVDGLELRDFWTPTMDTFAIHEWYRLLNCGYRVAAIGGTDKMSAGMPVGGVRTYAHIGKDQFTFDAWGKAVRAGRTYTTSGPLVSFSVEGRQAGDSIKMGAGGGHLRVEASAAGTMPFHKLQVVFNGNIVAEAGNPRGSRSLSLSEDIEVDRPGWLAARVISEHTSWHVWPVKFGAHTSPVYVEVSGSEVFDGPTAEYLITVLEGGLTWMNTLGIPASPDRHAAIKKYFEDGIAELRSKMPKDSHDPHVGGRAHSHGGVTHRH